jgi:type I restriction enzyme S subunit
MYYKLSDLTIDGKGSYGIAASAVEYNPNKYTYLRITDINDDGTINFDGLKSVDDENADKYLLKENDIVFARTGASTGRTYFYQKKDGDFVFAGFLIKYSLDPNKVNPRFLKYYTHSKIYYDWVHSFDSGATRGNINAKTFGDMLINLPERFVQDKIVSTLSNLDDKIAVNKKICENLEAQAQALFKHWFVDFAPFKDGKFVESELGLIPEGWRVGNLFDIASIFDKIRKPLSGKDREYMNKIYPYYGATSCMDYVDSYLFDGIYTLIGEDGSVVKEDGLPYMQYVWGKFWVNNHAHILQGKNGFSTEMVHVFLSRYNIKHLVTGAVQAKLSQANMQKIMLPIPPKDEINKIRPVIDSLYGKIRNCEGESSRLATLRDTLLPKLMSGELNISI